MDVRCPQCQTLYELDSGQLKSNVVTLKCSQCQNVFRFESNSNIVEENQRRWMVRNLESGDVYYLGSFDVLHQWIMEGKITRNDEISRTGTKWTLLDNIGEFVPMFQVVDSISNIASGSAARSDASSHTTEPTQAARPDQAPAATKEESSSPLRPSPDASTPEAESRERIPTSIQYGGAPASEEITQIERPHVTTGALQQETFGADSTAHVEADAWEFGDDKPDSNAQPEVDFDEFEIHQRSRWPLFLVALVLAACAGFFYLDSAQPAWWASLISPEDEPREVVAIGEPDAEEENDPATLVADALDQAHADVRTRHQVLFTKAVAASRPAMDRALGVATEEAEAWADGGALDELLATARQDLERGRHRQALASYREVLGHDSRNVDAIVGMGWVYLEQSQSAAAIEQFKSALEIDSNHGDAYIGLGSAERQRGKLVEAFNAYDLYLGKHPKGPKASIARYQLEQLRKRLGR